LEDCWNAFLTLLECLSHSSAHNLSQQPSFSLSTRRSFIRQTELREMPPLFACCMRSALLFTPRPSLSCTPVLIAMSVLMGTPKA
jgi:hypothetical protein